MTKHICDRCGIELENKEQFISFKVSFVNYTFDFNDFWEELELCESCASFIYSAINDLMNKNKGS